MMEWETGGRLAEHAVKAGMEHTSKGGVTEARIEEHANSVDVRGASADCDDRDHCGGSKRLEDCTRDKDADGPSEMFPKITAEFSNFWFSCNNYVT